MRRYSLVQTIGTGATGDPIRPPGNDYVVLADRGNWSLIKSAVPDGTGIDANTVADLDTTNGAVDVTATALTLNQRNAIRDRLAAIPGFDLTQWNADNPTTRRTVLRFIIQRLMQRLDLLDLVTLIQGFDVEPGS